MASSRFLKWLHHAHGFCLFKGFVPEGGGCDEQPISVRHVAETSVDALVVSDGHDGQLGQKIPLVECPDDDYVATDTRRVAELRFEITAAIQRIGEVRASKGRKGADVELETGAGERTDQIFANFVLEPSGVETLALSLPGADEPRALGNCILQGSYWRPNMVLRARLS